MLALVHEKSKRIRRARFIALVGVGAYFYFGKNRVGQVSTQDATASASDSQKIGNAKVVASGLNLYYKNHQTYPISLHDLIGSDGNIETESVGGVILGDKASQEKLFQGISYVKSTDSKHYVISVSLELSRDWPERSPKFNSTVQGNQLGVSCSDKNIYCIIDSSTDLMP